MKDILPGNIESWLHLKNQSSCTPRIPFRQSNLCVHSSTWALHSPRSNTAYIFTLLVSCILPYLSLQALYLQPLNKNMHCGHHGLLRKHLAWKPRAWVLWLHVSGSVSSSVQLAWIKLFWWSPVTVVTIIWEKACKNTLKCYKCNNTLMISRYKQIDVLWQLKFWVPAAENSFGTVECIHRKKETAPGLKPKYSIR